MITISDVTVSSTQSWVSLEEIQSKIFTMDTNRIHLTSSPILGAKSQAYLIITQKNGKSSSFSSPPTNDGSS